MTNQEIQKMLNQTGLSMAQTIYDTKPAFNHSSEQYICPFCETEDIKEGLTEINSMSDFQHYYGCAFLNASLYKEEIKILLK